MDMDTEAQGPVVKISEVHATNLDLSLACHTLTSDLTGR